MAYIRQKPLELPKLDTHTDENIFIKNTCIALGTFILYKLALLFFFLPLVDVVLPGAYHIQSEPDLYADIAWNVARGLGFRVYEDTSLTMLREPGYVYILAGIYTLFGKSIYAAQGLNIIFSLFSAVLLFKIACNARLSKTIALAAACIFLAHPSFIAVESRASLEATFAFFLILSVYAVQSAEIRPTLRSFAFAGLILGLTVMTRSTAAVFAAAAPIYLFFRIGKHTSFSQFMKKSAVYCGCFLLVMSVWAARNYSVTQEFVPIGTVAGDAFYQGWFTTKHSEIYTKPGENLQQAAAEANKIIRNDGITFKDGFFPTFYDSKDEVRRNKLLMGITTKNYMEEPWLLLKTMGRNVFRFWFYGPTPTVVIVNVLVVLPYLALFLYGAWTALHRRSPVLPALMMVGSVYFVNLFFITLPRHHTPIIPFMCIFMAVGLSVLFPKQFKKLEKAVGAE